MTELMNPSRWTSSWLDGWRESEVENIEQDVNFILEIVFLLTVSIINKCC